MSRADKFVFVVLGGTAVLCVAVLVTAVFRGTHGLVFYGAPILGLLLLAYARRLQPENRINLALTIVALSVAVYGAEAAMFFTEQGHYKQTFRFQDDRMREARRQGVAYDRRNQLEVVEGLIEEGVPAVAGLHPTLFTATDGLGKGEERVFPLSGVSNTVTVTCNESGDWIVVESDEHGFRNPPGRFIEGQVDVAVIGDSYAYGSCVHDGEGVAELLRRPGRRLLNVAYSGDGPLMELATLKEYAEPFTPKVVLWFYYEGNDLLDLRSERQSASLLAYLDPDYSQGLMGRRPELDRLLSEYHDSVRAAARSATARRKRCVLLLCGVRSLRLRTGPDAAPVTDLPVTLLGDVLAKAQDRITGWGGTFYVVYVPSWFRYRDGAEPDANFSSRKDVLDALHSSRIEVIDFEEVVSAHPDPLSLFPFRSRGHFTSEGYAMMAEHIERRLESRTASEAP